MFYKLIALLMITLSLTAKEKPATLCLNMIVKDERPVILKCLESVKPLIDYWVIVDTGSSDGTQKAIIEFMKDIPGELHERPWVDFAHNRNQALELAKQKADYCLFIDADEKLIYPKDFKMPSLTHDLYAITIRLTQQDGAIGSSPRAFLLKTGFKGKWKGVLHEQIHSESPPSVALLKNIFIQTDMTTGHRSQDPQKYLKDAQALEKGLENEPDNANYQFFIGASYELAGELQRALSAFEKCGQMGSADSDLRYRSLFQIGVLQQRLNKTPFIFLESYQKALRHSPHRAEPLFFMANYYVKTRNFQKAYDLLTEAVKLPLPTHQAFVERSIYTWASLYNLAICAEQLGKKEETKELRQKLISNPELPENLREVMRTRCDSKI